MELLRFTRGYDYNDVEGNTNGVIKERYVTIERYHVVKETAKTYTIIYHGKHKRILKSGSKKNVNNKRFAYIDIQEALTNFIERTRSCIKHSKNALAEAEAFLEIGQNYKNKTSNK